jgi:hypothetical protein
MAFSLDHGQIATPVTGGVVTSIALTTNVSVAAGGLIVIGFGCFVGSQGTTTFSISGGGLSWNPGPASGNGAANSDYGTLYWAAAPSGLASSTTITVTGSPANNLNGPVLGGSSWLGAASSPNDGQASQTGTTAAWNSGSVNTTGSSDLLVGVGWGDGNAATATDGPNTGYTAGWLGSQSSGGGVLTLVYQMNVAAGAYNPGGTWATSVPSSTNGVTMAFLASGAAAAGSLMVMAGPGLLSVPHG